MNRVHRARVSDVHVSQGTATVIFENHPYSINVEFPVLALSVPPQQGNSDEERQADRNYLKASWGRYIPQIGDVIYVAFGSDGAPYALGYAMFSYSAFGVYDKQNEARGGIGWGDSSGRPPLQPGDWDFKSSRASTFYLGDRVKLSSGPHSICINTPTGDLTTTTSLLIDRVGESSEIRHGGARRRALPTDKDETDIRTTRGGYAQEINISLKYGGTTPGGTELVRESLGDVIDETLITPMTGETGQFVRKLLQVKDQTGSMEVFSSKIDTGGNQVIEAQTATKFSWSTPLAAWETTSLSTKFTTTSTFDIEATAPLTMKSNSTATIEAPSISLGQAASEPVIKGTTLLNSVLTPVLSAMLGDWTALSSTLGIGSGSVTAISTALGQLANTLSTKVKTE